MPGSAPGWSQGGGLQHHTPPGGWAFNVMDEKMNLDFSERKRKTSVVSRVTVPKDVLALIPRTWKYVT